MAGGGGGTKTNPTMDAAAAAGLGRCWIYTLTLVASSGSSWEESKKKGGFKVRALLFVPQISTEK